MGEMSREQICRIEKKTDGDSVTKVRTFENLWGDHLTVTIENIGGADRDRTTTS